MTDSTNLGVFWAKLGRAEWPDTYHPVICHQIDVGQVAAALWRHVLPTPARERVAERLGLGEAEAGAWVAFWVAAHDIGKVTPGFQFMKTANVAELEKHLGAEGYTLDASDAKHHTCTGTKILCDALTEMRLDEQVAWRVAVCVGGHHGPFPANWHNLSFHLGDEKWADARREMLGHLERLFNVRRESLPSPSDAADQCVWMYLAGLTAVADWIGSNTDFFKPHVTPECPLANSLSVDDYFSRSRVSAENALERLGWRHQTATGAVRGFAEATGLRDEPRELQKIVIPIAQEMAASGTPRLVIVEAPMGEGKTEAAWYVADCWNRAVGAGTYLALPTMATSNQMFTRVERFLTAAGEKANLILTHGKAALNERFRDLQFAAETHDADGNVSGVVAAGWFAKNKKHGLLASFGVGTIDQALLAVLQTNHAFVRLFGLAGKCVILDEVHAYDAYMTTLMKRLLQWLAALGCPVVLLSATLPSAKRRELLEAYSGSTVGELATTYPCVTSVRAGQDEVPVVTPFEADKSRHKTFSLGWVEDGGLVGKLKEALSDGGCAVVIRNTVGLGQETFRALRPEFGDEVMLFHARFPFGRRDEIEKAVLERFGKGEDGKPENPQRPRRAVLVATQVVEQSLDLDFDVMFTDVAPVDLVLQRAGRLWRHDRERPEGLKEPQLWLICPDEKDGVPDFGPSRFVYDRFVLLRSWLTLKGCSEVRLPDAIEPFVERVYGEEFDVPPEYAADLEKSKAALDEQLAEQQSKASSVMIRKPDKNPLEQRSLQLREDDPVAHERVRAATRDTEPTIPVVLVYHRDGRDFLDPEGTEPFDASAKPDVPRIRRLLENEVTLSHRGAVAFFAKQTVPAGWKKCGMLQAHRLVLLDTNGQAQLGEYRLSYDREVGISIEK